jgi:hypothetical protein
MTWKRLTPGSLDSDDINIYTVRQDGIAVAWGYQEDGEVHKDVRSSPVPLSTDELNALAKLDPKVQALVDIARESLALMRLRMEQDAGLGRDRVMERVCDVLTDKLAQFEHPVARPPAQKG